MVGVVGVVGVVGGSRGSEVAGWWGGGWWGSEGNKGGGDSRGNWVGEGSCGNIGSGLMGVVVEVGWWS